MNIITYPGAKTKLVSQILPFISKSTKDTFIDIFCGSCSVASEVVGLNKFSKILANDKNSDLIEAIINLEKMYYNNENFEEDLRRLIVCPENKAEYYLLRDEFNQTTKDRWIPFLKLVSSCTNNLLRYNLKGGFNATYGERKITKQGISRIKRYFDQTYGKISYTNLSFNSFNIHENKCIYLDPPYSQSQVKYQGWNAKDDQELISFCLFMKNKNNDLILSSTEYHDGKKSPVVQTLEENGFTKINLDFDYEVVARIKGKKTNEVLMVNFS